jgi:hypothetical protein
MEKIDMDAIGLVGVYYRDGSLFPSEEFGNQ